MGDYMKLIYENMSVDEFMKRYNYMYDKEWYDENLKRQLLVDMILLILLQITILC